eukprot:scaffold114214_cov30-Tisochrysis_lutea.AAC.10
MTVTGSEKRGPREGSVASLAYTSAKCAPGGRLEGSSCTLKLCPPRSLAERSTIDAGTVTQSALRDKERARRVSFRSGGATRRK